MLKKILILGLVFSLNAGAENAIWDDSLKSAKMFCGSNNECIDIIALELDSSYRAGLEAKIKGTRWDLAVNRRAKQLTDLCDKAPNEDLCFNYRNLLLQKFVIGLSQ